MGDSLAERIAIERRQVASAETGQTAEDLRLAAASLRHVIDVGETRSLTDIEQDSGVEGVSFQRLIQASGVIDQLAAREQSIAEGLTQGAELIAEHGLPS